MGECIDLGDDGNYDVSIEPTKPCLEESRSVLCVNAREESSLVSTKKQNLKCKNDNKINIRRKFRGMEMNGGSGDINSFSENSSDWKVSSQIDSLKKEGKYTLYHFWELKSQHHHII